MRIWIDATVTNRGLKIQYQSAALPMTLFFRAHGVFLYKNDGGSIIR